MATNVLVVLTPIGIECKRSLVGFANDPNQLTNKEIKNLPIPVLMPCCMLQLCWLVIYMAAALCICPI